ncbi:hypothetical protein B0H10DRAFT_1408032 [Mycena sp. CBHHK59/15]|nr:hypothetical protein B0H10DRAFT_1408032 [Mycena sp. CBHHK59/15]
MVRCSLRCRYRLISLAAEPATSVHRRRPSRHPSRAVDILLAHTTDRWVTGRSRCTPVETTAVPVTGTACSPKLLVALCHVLVALSCDSGSCWYFSVVLTYMLTGIILYLVIARSSHCNGMK